MVRGCGARVSRRCQRMRLRVQPFARVLHQTHLRGRPGCLASSSLAASRLREAHVTVSYLSRDSPLRPGGVGRRPRRDPRRALEIQPFRNVGQYDHSNARAHLAGANWALLGGAGEALASVLVLSRLDARAAVAQTHTARHVLSCLVLSCLVFNPHPDPLPEGEGDVKATARGPTKTSGSGTATHGDSHRRVRGDKQLACPPNQPKSPQAGSLWLRSWLRSTTQRNVVHHSV